MIYKSSNFFQQLLLHKLGAFMRLFGNQNKSKDDQNYIFINLIYFF